MSRYGPADDRPGGPEGYPRPSDPWDSPADPWAGPPEPPPHHPAGERHRPRPWPEEPTWPDQPSRRGRRARPPQRRSGPLVALVVLLVLVVAGGVVATLMWVSDEPDGQAAGQGTPTGAPSPSATPDGEDAEVPDDRIGMGPVVAQPGDCLVNEGTASEPAMRIVSCDTDEDTLVYRVLARFDQQVSGDTPEEQDRSAQEICLGTENYEHHYRLVAANPEDSFVLCLDAQ